MLGMSLSILELFCWGVWQVFPPINRSQYDRLLETVAAIGTERPNELEVLHPYLGWAFNPEASEAVARHVGATGVNALGFVDSGPAIRKRAADRFVIGILGGSVAQQVTTIGEAALRARLASSPQLAGRQVEIVRLAMSGYKQPQQLMTLNYVLALGAEFDVVVNIDGYNETALVVGENDAHGVFAAYPRSWHVRLQDVVDPRTASISYRLLQLRALRQSRAAWVRSSGLSSSNLISLIWAGQEAILRNRQVQLGLDLVQHSKQRGFGFARQGPRPFYDNESDMYRQLTDLWRNSSLQMYHLCQGRQIRYLHLLQPNQYFPGSKPLSPEELRRFYSPDQVHAQAVERGYPLLLAAGAELRSGGVEFQDLTQLFADHTETLYSDYFCHYNASGTALLAETVADLILAGPGPATSNRAE